MDSVIAKRLNGSNSEVRKGGSEDLLLVEAEDGSEEEIEITNFRKRFLKGVYASNGLKIDVWADEALLLLETPRSHDQRPVGDGLMKIVQDVFDDFDFESDTTAKRLLEQIMKMLKVDKDDFADTRIRGIENALGKALRVKFGSMLTEIKRKNN